MSNCSQALATTLSALYGKLLVVMGIAFPMSEVISTHIPHSFYEVTVCNYLFRLHCLHCVFNVHIIDPQGYYLYLYFGSMAFLFYMYAMLLKGKPTMTPVNNNFSKYVKCQVVLIFELLIIILKLQHKYKLFMIFEIMTLRFVINEMNQLIYNINKCKKKIR